MDKTIAFRISEETYAKLRWIAYQEEMRVSDVCRRLIRRALKEEEMVEKP